MTWQETPLIGFDKQLLGLIDTGEYGVSPYAVPPNYLTIAKNVRLHADGGVSGRPGRVALNPGTAHTGALKWLDVFYASTSSSQLIVYKNGRLKWIDRSTGVETDIATGLDSSAEGHGAQYGLTGANGRYVFVNGVDAPITWDGAAAGAIVGLPAVLSQPQLFFSAGRRAVAIKGNTFGCTINDATLGAATDWQNGGVDMTGSIGEPGSPLDTIKAGKRWGRFFLLFTTTAFYRFDLNDDFPPNTLENVMEIGCVGRNAIVEAEGVLFWCDGVDVWAWTEGMAKAQSITKTANGVKTVAGRFENPSNSFAGCCMRYDRRRRLLLLSYRDSGATSNNNTLVYDVQSGSWGQLNMGMVPQSGAWSEWTFGASQMVNCAGPPDVQAPVLYGGLDGGIVWSLSDTAQLVDFNSASPSTTVAVEADFRTHHLRSVQDEVKVKDLFVGFENGSLGEIRVNLLADNETELPFQDIGVARTGGATYGSATYGGSSYAGSGLHWKRVPFSVQYSRGKLMAVRFRKQDGKKFKLVQAVAEAMGVDKGRSAD